MHLGELQPNEDERIVFRVPAVGPLPCHRVRAVKTRNLGSTTSRVNLLISRPHRLDPPRHPSNAIRSNPHREKVQKGRREHKLPRRTRTNDRDRGDVEPRVAVDSFAAEVRRSIRQSVTGSRHSTAETRSHCSGWTKRRSSRALDRLATSCRLLLRRRAFSSDVARSPTLLLPRKARNRLRSSVGTIERPVLLRSRVHSSRLGCHSGSQPDQG